MTARFEGAAPTVAMTAAAAALLAAALAAPAPTAPTAPRPADECAPGRPSIEASHVRQVGGGENDCAPAAMAAVLRRFGLLPAWEPAGSQIARLQALTPEPRGRGTSPWGARYALRELGVRAVVVAGVDALEAAELLVCGAALIRTERVPGQPLGHATAFVRQAGGIAQFDPERDRPRVLSAMRFLETWDRKYRGLVVENPGVTDVECLVDACRKSARAGAGAGERCAELATWGR